MCYNEIGGSMQSIKNTTTYTNLIQKSKFIAKIIPINQVEEVNHYLKKIKEEFKEATHYCYAYICGTEKRCSDDGEPSGTAGMPILNVLEKRGLNYVLCVVIRYFGGIKLGAGGLVRAYSNTVSMALNECVIVTLIPGKTFQCTFPYSLEKQINYILQDAKIEKKEYQNDIRYTVTLTDQVYQQLSSPLARIATITDIKNILVKKN